MLLNLKRAVCGGLTNAEIRYQAGSSRCQSQPTCGYSLWPLKYKQTQCYKLLYRHAHARKNQTN